jgi:hypothetical protein
MKDFISTKSTLFLERSNRLWYGKPAKFRQTYQLIE